MISLDLRNHPVTVVAFSGLAPQNDLFEWRDTFLKLPVNWIGVRDPHDRWFQTDTLNAADAIDNAISATHPSRTVFIGGSAGGFAALLFGRMLKPDRVLAFSPQTVCGPLKRDLGDLRWPEFCKETPHTEWSDLAGEHPRAEVHYALDDDMDVMHAERIVPGVVRTYREGGHKLPKVLKASGALKSIVEAALS